MGASAIIVAWAILYTGMTVARAVRPEKSSLAFLIGSIVESIALGVVAAGTIYIITHGATP